MKVGERIARAREAKGWTQSELARRSGITRSAINQIESGKTRRPNSENLVALAALLGLSERDVLHGGNDPVATPEQRQLREATRRTENYTDTELAEIKRAIEILGHALTSPRDHMLVAGARLIILRERDRAERLEYV